MHPASCVLASSRVHQDPRWRNKEQPGKVTPRQEEEALEQTPVTPGQTARACESPKSFFRLVPPHHLILPTGPGMAPRGEGNKSVGKSWRIPGNGVPSTPICFSVQNFPPMEDSRMRRALPRE